MIKLRWLIPCNKQTSKHEYLGEKWINSWEYHSQRILQYSFDGENWYNVECSYVDVPESEKHLYQWDSKIVNNKLSILK